MTTVLVTDYAWPDLAIEQEVFASAGLRLVSGPPAALPAQEIAALVHDHQPASILTCWARVDAAAVGASAQLRHVGRIGVGLDNIDVAACSALRIPVTNVPDYCVEEVSDHVLAFTLAWARGIASFDREVRGGLWQPAGARLRRVADLTVGVVGYGQIGRATTRKFAALGCRVLVHSRSARDSSSEAGFVSLDHLLAHSDVVALHLPLTPETHHLIDAARLERMKEGAFLVNVSRGGIVDTQALVAALRTGRLSGAGLDVLESEPQVPQDLLEQPRALLTPHIAFSSTASLAELRRRAAEETVRVLSGQQALHLCNNID